MDYKMLLSHLFEGAYVVDDERKIIAWNQVAEAITGYQASEVIGQYCYDNILRHIDQDGDLLCHHGCPLQDSIHSNKTNEASVSLHHKAGHRIPVRVKTLPFKDEKTGRYMAVELFQEVSKMMDTHEENKALKRELEMDALTEIFNRRFIDYQLSLAVHEHDTFKTTLALLFIDIDHFKNINDTYGHDVGDEVLKSLAKTLALNVRQSDYVGRYGGEEFVIILRHVDYETMHMLAERLRLLIEEMTIPIDQDEPIRITVSIGGAMYHEQTTMDNLIKNADKNMYQAKSQGRNQVVCTRK